MRKLGIYTWVIIGVMALASVSCSNKDSEKKIAELENRINELEGSGAGTNNTAANPAIPTPTAQPETKPEGPIPVFAFEESTYDFGTISEGDVVKHTFQFKNTGEAPLIIQSARGSCGCTVPSWPKEPIPVGETAEVTAEFNSKGKSGVQNKTITITANTWPKNTTLSIKANVTPSN